MHRQDSRSPGAVLLLNQCSTTFLHLCFYFCATPTTDVAATRQQEQQELGTSFIYTAIEFVISMPNLVFHFDYSPSCMRSLIEFSLLRSAFALNECIY